MSADDAVLAMLRAVPNLNVYDGYVDADETQKVVSVPLPYVVYFGGDGEDFGARLCGGVSGQVHMFQVTAVGSTREQSAWARKMAQQAVSRKRVDGAVIRRVDGAVIRRDDDYTRPGGGPLFYGVDQYVVPV